MQEHDTFIIQLRMLRERFDTRIEKRNELSTPLRKAVRKTKESIYQSLAHKLEQAEATLKDAEEAFTQLLPEAEALAPRIPSMLSTLAMELVEAHATRVYATEERLITREESVIDDDEAYLSGLLDATGEILRMALNRAPRDACFLIRARDWLRVLYDELTLFSLPNGELRRKYDTLKYTVKKLEDAAFTLLVSRKLDEAHCSRETSDDREETRGEHEDEKAEKKGLNKEKSTKKEEVTEIRSKGNRDEKKSKDD